MQVNKGVLTAGILVVAGFCGGFLLSNGSGQILGMKPAHKTASEPARKGGTNANEVLAVAIINAADGDGAAGEGGGGHPAINQAASGGVGGAGEAGTGASSAGSGGAGDQHPTINGGAGAGEGHAGAAGSGPDGAGGASMAGVKAAPSPSAPAMLAGTEALNVLVGNTVDATVPDQAPRLTYYAPRGLRVEGNDRGFVVKPSNRMDKSLCEPGPDGALVCRPMQVSRDPGDHPAGARIGVVLIAGNRWVPIYKGNLLGFPDHIPMIDSDLGAEMPAPAGLSKATVKGKDAVSTLVGHAAAVEAPNAALDRPRHILYLAPDGKRFALERPELGADPSDGIAVTVGRWTFAKGLLCQGEGAIGSVPSCFKPEAWGPGSIRLVPASKGAEQRLTILTESLRPRQQAAN